MITTLVIVFVVVAALFALGLMLLRGSRREPVAVSTERAAEPLVAAPPVGPETPRLTLEEPVAEEEAPPSAPEPEAISVPSSSSIRWSKRFDPATGPLDDESRLKLIRDLGFLRGAWCIPLLAQAYDEETAPEHRRAVLIALAAYRHPDARATMQQALLSDDAEERSIAAAALKEILGA